MHSPPLRIRAMSALMAAVILPALMTAAAPDVSWSHGPPADPNFFPIAVWLQSPARARDYAAAGINTYVGLWKGPTEEQLASLKAAGMKLICDLNEVGRRHRDDPTIIGWMHGDEPDNAQARPGGGGYGPPVDPARIVEDYQRIKLADPTRPVLLNLGQGVAWDNWHGRGSRTRHPEDYAEYVKGSDIVSFDIYPAAHDHPEVAGKLWYVARGVERLVQWAEGRPVWNCIECTRISHPTAKATPAQVRAEVWMSLVSGSQGLIYFVHEWKPRFNEAALLADPDMLAAVTAINRQVLRLAPVLHAPALPDAVRVTVATPDVVLGVRVQLHEGSVYVFAVNLRDTGTTAQFELQQPSALGQNLQAQVLDEQRSLAVQEHRFSDTFEPWGVHLYRIPIPLRTAEP